MLSPICWNACALAEDDEVVSHDAPMTSGGLVGIDPTFLDPANDGHRRHPAELCSRVGRKNIGNLFRCHGQYSNICTAAVV